MDWTIMITKTLQPYYIEYSEEMLRPFPYVVLLYVVMSALSQCLFIDYLLMFVSLIGKRGSLLKTPDAQ